MRVTAPDGLELEVTVEGSGEPVVLLHGWPDSSRLWRHQIEALTAAGRRVIAPDLRGMGGSDRPASVEGYRVKHAVADVLAVLDAVGAPQADVVGHDFGAAVAWATASFVPDRVRRLAVLSVGHPLAFRAAGLDQRALSWYMLLFQFEGVAEAVVRRARRGVPGQPSRPRRDPRRAARAGTAHRDASVGTAPTPIRAGWSGRRRTCRRSRCRCSASGAAATSR